MSKALIIDSIRKQISHRVNSLWFESDDFEQFQRLIKVEFNVTLSDDEKKHYMNIDNGYRTTIATLILKMEIQKQLFEKLVLAHKELV